MSTVRVRLELGPFDNTHLAHAFAESNARVQGWHDNNFKRRAVKLSLAGENASQVHEMVLEGTAVKPAIPDSAAIGFGLMVDTRNHAGIHCTVDAGTDYILLSSAVVGASGTLEFRVRSADNLLKGVLPYKVVESNVESLGIPFTKSALVQAGVGDVGAVSELLTTYIRKTIAHEQRFKDPSEVLSRIRVPAFIGEAGLERVQNVPLPACAYAMYETPESNVECFENMFVSTLLKHGISQDEFKTLTRRDKARCLMAVSSMVAQSFPYIGDSVNRNHRDGRYQESLKQSCENFGDAFCTHSGDCEDLASAIMMVHSALQRADLSQTKMEGLKELQQISKHYSMVLCLDSVTSAAVGQSAGAIGAHMNVFGIPNQYLSECITRYNPTVARRWPFDQRYMDAGLPVLTGEGTGLFETTSYGDTHAAARSLINSMPGIEAFGKEIVHKEGEDSTFYRKTLTGYTRAAYEKGSGYIGLTFVNHKGERGVDFIDLENSHDGVKIAPHPLLDDEVRAICEEAVAIRVPPDPLVLTVDAKRDAADPLWFMGDDEKQSWEIANKLVADVSALNRTTAHPAATAWIEAQAPINIFSQNDADKVLSAVRAAPGIVSVRATYERVMDGVPCNLRLGFYCDPTASVWKAAYSQVRN
jgi:hypothetical protein